MTKEEFYELLDIESADDFQYFENLAAYFECDEDISETDVAFLFSDVDKKTLAQLIDNYFEEISDFVPGSETELFAVLENVRRAFTGMCKNNDEDETIQTKLAEELERFRIWYSVEKNAFCTEIASLEENAVSIRDALVFARLENLDGTKYQYDFSQCTDYKLDEYIMSLGDIVGAEYSSEDE